MAASPTRTVEVDAELLERARQVADERGVTVPQLVRKALEHELVDSAPKTGQSRPAKDESAQPPLTYIERFARAEATLSKLASEDAFESEPFR